jgi:hypothetical protein
MCGSYCSYEYSLPNKRTTTTAKIRGLREEELDDPMWESSGDLNSCQRKTYKDSDYCIWHSEINNKSRSELNKARKDHAERLDGAYLGSATISGIDFQECSLRWVDFTNATARKTRFYKSNLVKADFNSASIQEADFSRARLKDVKFQNAQISWDTKFDEEISSEKIASLVDAESYPQAKEQFRRFGWSMRTYRELSHLHDENGLPEKAKKYFLSSKRVQFKMSLYQTKYDLKREKHIFKFISLVRNFPEIIKHILLGRSSGYGTNTVKLIQSAVYTIIIFSAFYPVTGIRKNGNILPTYFDISMKSFSLSYVIKAIETMIEYFVFSLASFSTLSFGGITPVGLAAVISRIEALIGILFIVYIGYSLNNFD